MNRRTFLFSGLSFAATGCSGGCGCSIKTNPTAKTPQNKWDFYTQEQILEIVKQSKHTLSFSMRETLLDEHYKIMFDFVKNAVRELGPGMPWVVTSYRLAIYFQEYPGTSSLCARNGNFVDAGIIRNVRLILENKHLEEGKEHVLPHHPYRLVVGVHNDKDYSDLPKETRLLKVYEGDFDQNDKMRKKPVLIEERQR